MVENAWFKEVNDFCGRSLSETYGHLFTETRTYPDTQILCLKLSKLHQLPPNSMPYLDGPKDIELILKEAEEVIEEMDVEVLDAMTGKPYERINGYLKVLNSLSIGKRIDNIPEDVSKIFWAYSTIKSRLER